ncbi:hypothetical protein UFOVP121_54 [uncultured Caudovirales phage]|uniref:Phage P22-like portal protein n=1 Tax=uncultured Caudovirales phage TaxID=2100421 RepID=A0A6J5L961_9CAUD|nr:hypothetical protein UFOVP121_54 [uncultured Caudovirales phage]CAB4135052.1 hypothetical protein UFOVP277_59 [uncultured Caudovirales phage]
MPVNTELATKTYYRYAWVRDAGHSDFVKKAELCERFFRGMQWDEKDLALLKAQRRPALVINKILSTISNVMGDQIYNRSEVSFQPRSGAPSGNADVLTKLFKYISQDNQLDWLRSDVFADGIITSRGFYDVRMDFNDNLMGDVRTTRLNPKNVLIDPDATEYDPDTWNDVLTTKWLTADEIAVLYNEDDADYLRNRAGSYFPYGYDSIDYMRDRFGDRNAARSFYTGVVDESSVQRSVRVIERQHRKLDKQRHFYDMATGDLRAIPDNWTRDRIAAVRDMYKLEVVTKLVNRIRWTVTADTVVLHDDWSPYKHFTVVPFFPYLRNAQTVGLVENLLGPQELLNKVSSQELHVINTTANSGWKVKTGSLRNMSIEELEQRGAETGLVMELDDPKSVEKIQPNQVPSGLDRLTYKAEEHIKTISGVSDYQTGNAREDVSAKAVAMNTSRGSFNLAKVTDSLNRTDHILARNILDLVQGFYTDQRVVNVVKDRMTGETETISVNEPAPTPENPDALLNDLTLGEYDVVVTSTPVRETLEDSQFQQALSLRELGIQIPDSTLLENSRLLHKSDIIAQMKAAQEAPEAVAKRELEKTAAELEVANLKAEAAKIEADAMLKQARADKENQSTAQAMQGGGNELEMARAQFDMQAAREKHQLEMEKLRAELEFTRQQNEMKLQQMQREGMMKVAQKHADTFMQMEPAEEE